MAAHSRVVGWLGGDLGVWESRLQAWSSVTAIHESSATPWGVSTAATPKPWSPGFVLMRCAMGGRGSVLALNNEKPVDLLYISFHFPTLIFSFSFSGCSVSLSSLFCARCSRNPSIPRGAPKHPKHNRWGRHSLGSCCGSNARQWGRKSKSSKRLG